MRYGIVILCAFALVACATPGPGANCDPCATAEANPVGAGSQAAAAAASGGQRANQAPFADDTARLSPQTTVGRGAGATTSNSADSETRHVVSGGAQNLAVLAPNQASASTSGGTSPAVCEAQRTVAAARSAWLCAAQDPMSTTEKVQALYLALREAQEALAAAESGSRGTVTNNYHFAGARINQLGLSTSSTDGKPDPASVEAVSKAGLDVGTAVFSDEMYESSSAPSTGLPPAPAAADSLHSEPPAGAVPEVPSDG